MGQIRVQISQNGPNLGPDPRKWTKSESRAPKMGQTRLQKMDLIWARTPENGPNQDPEPRKWAKSWSRPPKNGPNQGPEPRKWAKSWSRTPGIEQIRAQTLQNGSNLGPVPRKMGQIRVQNPEDGPSHGLDPLKMDQIRVQNPRDGPNQGLNSTKYQIWAQTPEIWAKSGLRPPKRPKMRLKCSKLRVLWTRVLWTRVLWTDGRTDISGYLLRQNLRITQRGAVITKASKMCQIRLY